MRWCWLLCFLSLSLFFPFSFPPSLYLSRRVVFGYLCVRKLGSDIWMKRFFIFEHTGIYVSFEHTGTLVNTKDSRACIHSVQPWGFTLLLPFTSVRQISSVPLSDAHYLCLSLSLCLSSSVCLSVCLSVFISLFRQGIFDVTEITGALIPREQLKRWARSCTAIGCRLIYRPSFVSMMSNFQPSPLQM